MKLSVGIRLTFIGFSMESDWLLDGCGCDSPWTLLGVYDARWFFAGFSLELYDVVGGNSLDFHWVFNGI